MKNDKSQMYEGLGCMFGLIGFGLMLALSNMQSLCLFNCK